MKNLFRPLLVLTGCIVLAKKILHNSIILITNFLSDQLQPFPQQLRKSVGYEYIYRDKARTTL